MAFGVLSTPLRRRSGEYEREVENMDRTTKVISHSMALDGVTCALVEPLRFSDLVYGSDYDLSNICHKITDGFGGCPFPLLER